MCPSVLSYAHACPGGGGLRLYIAPANTLGIWKRRAHAAAACRYEDREGYSREGTKVCASFFIISASLSPIRFLGVPSYFVATYAGRLAPNIAWSYVSSSAQLLLYRERQPGRGRYRYRITEQRLVDCLCRNIHSSPPLANGGGVLLARGLLLGMFLFHPQDWQDSFHRYHLWRLWQTGSARGSLLHHFQSRCFNFFPPSKLCYTDRSSVYFGDYRVVCDLSVWRAGNIGNAVERWTPRARCANGCSKQSFCAAGEVRFTLPLARCFDG